MHLKVVPVFETQPGHGPEFHKFLRKSLIARESGKAFEFPTIAQLVERPTVVANSQLSGGPWFESGWSDLFYAYGNLSLNASLFNEMTIRAGDLTVTI